MKTFHTRAPPPSPEPGRQHGLRPVALSSRALCKNAPKHFRLDLSTRRRMALLSLTCLTSPPNSKLCPAAPAPRNKEAFNSPTRRCPKGSRMQPKLWCSSRRSPCFLLLARSCRQCRGRLLGARGRMRQTPKDAVRGSNMFLQRPQSNPKICLKT